MRIVVTHGRAQAYQISGSLERLWEEALRDGLRAVGHDPGAPTIDFAFYGDIWRPDRRALADGRERAEAGDGAAERGDDEERGGEGEERSGAEERGGDDERAQAAADAKPERDPSLRQEPTELQVEIASELLPPDPDAERLDWNRLADVISELDRRLGVGKPLLTWFLKDLDEYFRDATIRGRVHAAVRQVLQASDEPTILLGHSMGTIVGYDLLSSEDAAALNVRALVTFGSPLGMASVHARVGQLHHGTPYPRALGTWINVYNEQDFATVVRFLNPHFPAEAGPGVVDRESIGRGPSLFDPGRGHDPIMYLSSVGLATAVRELLEAEQPRPPMRSRGIGSAVEEGSGRTRARPPLESAGPEDGERGGPLEMAGPDDGERGGPPESAGPDDGERGGTATAGAAPGETERGEARPRRRAARRNGGGQARGEARARPGRRSKPGMRTVERTASADFPPVVEPGSKHELRVAISGEAIHARHTDPIAIDAPVDQHELALRVGVYAADFSIASVDDPSKTWADLTVNLDDPAAIAEARFTLTATKTKERRESVVYVTIYRGNLPVGQLSLLTAIDPIRDVRAVALALAEPTARDPDFVLVVTDKSPGIRGAGPFDISASKEGEYLNLPLGTFPVAVDAWDYARGRLEGFRSVKDERTPEDRILAAEALGLDLWWDLPDDFRRWYWDELHGRDVSIAIYSQEPYIPWELVRPQREQGGGEEAPFLGVSFRIARWKQALRFPDPLAVEQFAVIAPQYLAGSGSRPLPGAQLEAQELVARFRASLLGGDRAAVRSFLQSGDGVQLVHFAGHGEFDPEAKDDTVIKLADAPLLPQDIHRAKLGRASHPFVFLNACEVGEQGWALTRIGGWAQAFTDVGFSGFVGPYWAVNDRIARKVAHAFYGGLAGGLTVGEALRGIRQRFYDDPEDRGHPSWLAYTLHCQPNVHVRMDEVAPAAGPQPG